MLLYDPRKLAAPWDQTSCSGQQQQPTSDLHWQHSASGKLARTAAKEQVPDSQTVRSLPDQAATPRPAGVPDLAALHTATTPAPATRAVSTA